jgi:GntR family transcriptional regulator, rspAB operon transcriptional repressor
MNVQEKIPSLRLDRSRRAAPQVFEKLREFIVSLELPPGAILSRAELAERFKLSQTPIRDALIRLGEEGLVDIFQQHATLVSRISVASARQAHFLRRAIELEVVRKLASTATDGLIARLRGYIACREPRWTGPTTTTLSRPIKRSIDICMRRPACPISGSWCAV